MRLHAMSKYVGSSSMPINLRPLSKAILPVVPLPMNGSKTVSPSFDQLMIWSCANFSGKTAGCFVLLVLAGVIFQMLYLAPYSLTFLPILLPLDLTFFPLLVIPPPPTTHPAYLFFLSQMRFADFLNPLEKTNIYSKAWMYLFLCWKGEHFCQIIVSCSRNPHSLAQSACLNDVPVSLPLIVAYPTTHTTTPPSLVTRYKSLIAAFQTCSPQ